jgi:hypothetical protein
MKSIGVFSIVLGLAGVLIISAAFIDQHYEKTIKNLQATADNKGFAVVELFTSEGCSSCPPADELIEKIQKDNKNRQIYIMAFHVDYWDRQGWKDKFSDPEFSDRQRRYASWLHLQTVYTPQLVVNGTSEYVGADQGPILKAVSKGLEQTPGRTLTLNCRIEGRKVHVNYQSPGEEKNTELVLSLIQKSAKSNIGAGENSGKSLSHVQIVRQLLRVDLNSRKAITMYLPDNFNEKGWELIGLVQNKTDGHITAAARFDLQSANP